MPEHVGGVEWPVLLYAYTHTWNIVVNMYKQMYVYVHIYVEFFAWTACGIHCVYVLAQMNY